MRNFLRALKYSWPYRVRLIISLFAALAVAALWSLNLALIYPVLKIMSEDKSLHQWIDDEIESYRVIAENPVELQHAKNLRADKENNTADELIANLDRDCAGDYIKLSVQPDGKSYVVTIPARGHRREFQTKAH